jgi:flagellar M-ring protein FliF
MGSLIQNTSTKGKIGMAAAAIGVVLVAIMLMKMATSPSYSTIATGVDPAQTGKMTAALDTKGIKWKLVNNGTGIAVDSGQTAGARVALAEQGLPQNGQAGFELFDKQKLGASNLQQQVTYQRALEGELAQTIEQVQGVTSAQVNLVLPEEQLFSDQNSQSKASVLLASGGQPVDPNSVRGIAQLVAGGVKGLQLQNVSITDSTGQLLWPTGDSLGSGPSANLKQAAQSRYDQQLGAQLQAMLDQTVGSGKGTVQVNSDLNVDQTSKDALLYAKKGVPLTQQKQNEKLKGAGAATGTSGTGSNIPSYSAGGSSGGNNYNNASTNTTFGVSKTVEHTKVAPGAVNKLGVAVLVDKSVPPATVAQLQSALGAAAGITPKRGDTITVSQVAFAKQPPVTTPKTPINPIGYAKYVLLGLGLMAFLFFMMRHLKKREDETLLRKPTWLTEIEAPTSLAELEARTADPVMPMPQESPMKKGLEELADKSPDRVAQQVRLWMNEA